MAKHISNMNELAKALQPVMLKMVDQLADRVYETLNYFLQDYYSGYEPSSYQRSKDFLFSAVKVDAHPYKGGVRASVYIDYDSLNNYGVSGYQVARWSNEGTHGGMEVDHKPHVWDDTMRETVGNGELLRLAVDYLKRQGISVRG
ncbi:MAG: hypothetical protein HFI10_09985 [Lachnospiraceae bacterium]|jgi:hypothetical protein|nr:hypothetical protein [Lachnospiraceae bacterium]